MSSPVKIASWESWEPANYFRNYYSRQVEPDEQAAIQFQIEFLQRSGRKHPLAIEYGCGPTLMRVIAAAPYVDRLDMADHLPGNLHQVRRWASHDPGADDWSQFRQYALRCEKEVNPNGRQVAAREQLTRGVLSDFLLTDARERHPLGLTRVASYDLLISGFCLDCLSRSKNVWRRCMRNVFGLLKPGGSFVVLALRGCPRYRIEERWFPGANIQSDDLKVALLACNADPVTLQIVESATPSHANQGYEGVLLSSGQTLPHGG